GSLPASSANALNQRSTTSYLPSTLADSSGQGNAATWSGNLTFGSPGLVSGNGDTAAGFDGSTSFAQVPGAAFGSYPTSGSTTAYAASFEAWFETTGSGVILSQSGGAVSPPAVPGGWVPALYVDTAGALHENLFYSAGGKQNVAAGPYNDGRPHQVAA